MGNTPINLNINQHNAVINMKLPTPGLSPFFLY